MDDNEARILEQRVESLEEENRLLSATVTYLRVQFLAVLDSVEAMQKVRDRENEEYVPSTTYKSGVEFA
jgi:hypothetical protein